MNIIEQPPRILNGVPQLGRRIVSGRGINGARIVAIVAAGGGGVTYLYQTDFPGTSVPAGFSTNPTVTVGSNLLNCLNDGAEAFADNLITSQNEVWVYFQLIVNSSVGDPPRIFGLFDPGFSNVQLYVDLAGNKFNVYDSGGLVATTTNTWTTATTYNIWIHYKKVTVANDGIASVAFSTTTTEPTSGSNFFAGVTNAVSTSAVTSLALQALFGATESVSFKKLRVANVPIGDNPS